MKLIMSDSRHCMDTEVCGIEWDDRDDPAIHRGWGYSCQLDWEHDGLHRCDDFEWAK